MPSAATSPPPPVPGRRGLRLGLIAVALVVAVLAAELLLRVFPPAILARAATVSAATAAESPLHPRHGTYQLDPELGFRPVLGGPLAGLHGCAPNEYASEKPPGVRRLLLVGDSVTQRGAIAAGLREVLGEEGIELWNGGVGGYATHQVERYYARYQAGLGADHVVYTFHLNDFVSTPVVFLDGDKLVICKSPLATKTLRPWLFRWSYLFRWWLARNLAADTAASPEARPEVVQEVEDALVALRDEVEARGARFTVLVFPWLRPLEKWPPHIAHAHAAVLGMLRAHGIAHFDLVDVLETALTEGEVVQQFPRDVQHPSPAFGLRIARAIVERGFRP
ncbi:MAG: hypothetical protein AB1726_00180 [Planctomycetota bacterium]